MRFTHKQIARIIQEELTQVLAEESREIPVGADIESFEGGEPELSHWDLDDPEERAQLATTGPRPSTLRRISLPSGWDTERVMMSPVEDLADAMGVSEEEADRVKRYWSAQWRRSVPPGLREDAPPGREDQVKALKGKVDNPYAVAWSQHEKYGNPSNEADSDLDEAVWEDDDGYTHFPAPPKPKTEADEDNEPFSAWTQSRAKSAWQKMGGDFETVASKAEEFADDPKAYAAYLEKKATGKWPAEEASDSTLRVTENLWNDLFSIEY